MSPTEDRKALLARIRERLDSAADGVLQDIATKLGLARASVTELPPGPEDRKLEQHYDTNAKTFSETGTSKQELLGAFKLLRRKDPSLTAEQFLGMSRAR
jgi:hypothetical protein